MKTITLKIDNAGAHYATAGLLPWAATNLPAGSFRFRERDEVYWEVAMTAYDQATATLHLQVVDYLAEAADFRPDRTMKRPVRALHFAPLNAEAFKAQLAYYKIGALSGVLQEKPAPPTDFAPAAAPPTAQTTTQTRPPTRAVSFTFPLLELTFGNGGVKGKTELPGLAEPVAFGIPNDHLVAEFDAIKPFFVKALKRQTIQVEAHLDFQHEPPRLVNAHSPQIARINDDMLELFRGRAVKKLLSPDGIKTIDKSLFTPEDIFDSLDDDELGSATLPRDGQDLLAEILRHKQVRNRKQLEFLAGRMHQPGTKLRYVLSPQFGFVFLVIGREANHFVLELLDSHATYVWSIPKFWETLEAQYLSVEKEIAAIGQLGRSQYRRTLHFEHEFWFIVHEAAESGVTDGFPRWKNRLLEGMV